MEKVSRCSGREQKVRQMFKGKKKVKVLSHFVLFLRAKAFLPGFYRYCIAEHQTHAPKDRTDENTKVKKSGGELPRKISRF